jgi:hypothetical protein
MIQKLRVRRSGLPKKWSKQAIYILLRCIMVAKQLGHLPNGPRVTPNLYPLDPFLDSWPTENRQWKTQLDRPQSHEESEAQTLVKRIEKQVYQEAAREAETKRSLTTTKTNRQL